MTCRNLFTLPVSVGANEGRKIIKSNTYATQLGKIEYYSVKNVFNQFFYLYSTKCKLLSRKQDEVECGVIIL